MNPLPAKYAGTCARTGQPYQPGDLIVKLANGKWALAQDKTGNIKVAPDFRVVRLPSGKEVQTNINAPVCCSPCVRNAGIDPQNPPQGFDFTPYQMARLGEAFDCPRCGRRIEIVPQSELDARQAAADAEREAAYLADMEANLHLTPCPYGLWQLSHRLPRAQWEQVKDYFVYWSADDLDEFDFFDMPGGYYLRPGKAPEGVFLNSPLGAEGSTAEAVEEILNIRPENRLALLIPKWEREEAERKARKAEKEAFLARFQAAFDPRDATRPDAEGNPFQRGAEKVALPSGGERLPKPTVPTSHAHFYYVEPSGAAVWDIYTNGADGDDWSADNTTGGIGYRFEMTLERRALLDEWKRQQKGESDAQV